MTNEKNNVIILEKKRGKNMPFNLEGYNPELDQKISKFIKGEILSEEEIDMISNISMQELAIRVVNITKNDLLALKIPKAIICAAAVLYGNILQKNDKTSELEGTEIFKSNYNAIAMAIEQKENQALNEKGPTR